MSNGGHSFISSLDGEKILPLTGMRTEEGGNRDEGSSMEGRVSFLLVESTHHIPIIVITAVLSVCSPGCIR